MNAPQAAAPTGKQVGAGVEVDGEAVTEAA